MKRSLDVMLVIAAIIFAIVFLVAAVVRAEPHVTMPKELRGAWCQRHPVEGLIYTRCPADAGERNVMSVQAHKFSVGLGVACRPLAVSTNSEGFLMEVYCKWPRSFLDGRSLLQWHLSKDRHQLEISRVDDEIPLPRPRPLT
jgi:hypothetical protein